MTLEGTDVIHGHFHAWIEREVSCPRCQSHFKPDDADPTSTTGTICNGRRTIAVGAYNFHDPDHRMGPFSSVGPTRDGRLKPDLCAPGVSVLAARSAQRVRPQDTPALTRMSGTSMAAPHVTGAVALAFQAAVRKLRIEETHNLLLGSARREHVPEENPDRLGIGMLDIEALVAAAGRIDASQRTFNAVREKHGAPTPAPPAPAVLAVPVTRQPDGAESDSDSVPSSCQCAQCRQPPGEAMAAESVGVSRERGRELHGGEPTPIDADAEFVGPQAMDAESLRPSGLSRQDGESVDAEVSAPGHGGWEPAVENPVESTDGATAPNTDPRHWFLSEAEILAARGGSLLPRTLAAFTSTNRVEPLIDGAAYMQALHDDLVKTRAGDFFHLTAWRLNIAQDLVPAAAPSATSPSRVDNLVKALAGRQVSCRALIFQAVAAGLPGISYLPVIASAAQVLENRKARDWWNAVGGRGVIDGRFPLFGSHHQKTAIVQREGETVAYCGGIDLAPDRWDTPQHDADPRRTRENYAGWHDVHLRIRGQAVRDIETNFRDRWNAPSEIPSDKIVREPVPPPITLPPPPVAASPGTHCVQILRTHGCAHGHYRDFAPFGEITCLAGYLKAIDCARRYIYIEDQYLVSGEIARALVRALDHIDKLVIVVPAHADTRPEQSNLRQGEFIDLLTARHRPKVHVYHLIQPTTGELIYVHAKVMIIDDVYAVTGSPNVNRRSMTHDTELAAAVVDADLVDGVCRYARDFRRQLWAEHLMLSPSDPLLADPISGVLEWERQAATGRGQVRPHPAPSKRSDFPPGLWNRVIDPEARCGAAAGAELDMTGEAEHLEDAVVLVDRALADIADRRDPLTLLRALIANTPLSAGAVFDVFAHGIDHPTAGLLRERLELVAGPGSVLTLDVQAGDVLVRRADAGQAYLALLASPALRADAARSMGLRLEQSLPGHYAQVLDAGLLPHDRASRFGRRIADGRGLIPANQLILRPRWRSSDANGEEDVAAGSCETLDDFGYDKSKLTVAHVAQIDKIAARIRRDAVPAVQVVGHASKEGTDVYNDGLAQRRADSVGEALRAALERQAPGSSQRIVFRVETRGKHDPVSADQRLNRRVQVCFAAAPSLEAPLRALLTASLVLTGNASAPFTSGTTLPAATATAGKLWRYRMLFGAAGSPEAQGVSCQVTHAGGYRMAMPVLDRVRWEDPSVTLPGGQRAVLPLRPVHLLGSFHSPAGRIGGNAHPIWRLESDHDLGTALVFGFDLSDPDRPGQLTTLEGFGKGAASRGPRILVVCELVLCRARADFEPGGVLEAARVYPIAEILAESDAITADMTVLLERPDRSPMDHGWYGRGAHLTGLFTDRNVDQGLVAFATAALTGNAGPVPTWENMFDYTERNAARGAVHAVVVNPALAGTRVNTTDRGTLNRLHGTYSPSIVSKVARQGEFDNVHIAPQMQVELAARTLPVTGTVVFSGLGPLGVSMAPLCAHDCFHMHWRWGQGYTTPHTKGWGAAGPYTEAGAPMVAPNQRIEIDVPAGRPALAYRAISNAQPAGHWAVVMPHGAAYAIQLKLEAPKILRSILATIPLPLRELAKDIVAAAVNEDAAWSWIYFFLQYWPTLSAPHFEELLKLANPLALRKL